VAVSASLILHGTTTKRRVSKTNQYVSLH
jgi:hypothetical protein